MRHSRSTGLSWIPFLLCAGGFLTAGSWVVVANGSTNDEYAAHITGGYLYWSTGVFAGGVHNPPLGQLWVSLPMWLTGHPLQPFTDAAPVLARIPNLLLGAALLYWVYAVAGRRGTTRGALVAGLTVACCPEFLTHSALATLELPTTFTLWAGIMTFSNLLLRPGLRNLILFGLATGSALLVKVTGFFLFPICAGLAASLILSVPGRRYLSRLTRGTARRRAAVLGGVLVYTLLVWLLVAAAYRFDGVGTAKGSGIGALFTWILPAGFVEATVGKLKYASAGNATYLLGLHSSRGWWWYYPAVLALKTPLPLLMLWILSVVWCLLNRTPRRLLHLIPPVLFLTFAMTGNRAQIGVRHLLPIVPFLGLLAGSVWDGARPRIRLTAAGLAAASVAAGLLTLPYPITAESLLLRGKGYRAFADANYDWGQANGGIRRVLAAEAGAKKPQPYTPAEGRFVLRVNELNGFGRPDRDEYNWLRNFEPHTRIQGAGLVYTLSREDLEVVYSTAAPEGVRAFEGAMYRAAQGLWPEARELFEAALRSDPAPARLLHARGQLHEQQGALQEALRDYRRAARLEPERASYKDAADRLELLVQAVPEKGGRAQSAFYKANAALLEREWNSAEAFAMQALREGAPALPTEQIRYRAATLAGDWSKAVGILERTPEAGQSGQALPGDLLRVWRDGTATTGQLLEIAGWAYLQRSWATAAELLLQAVADQPRDSRAASLVGQIVIVYKEGHPPMSDGERSRLESVMFPPKK